MGPSKHIKQHDFISGKPKTMWFIGPDWGSSNPCSEIRLGVDSIDCTLQEGGYQQGELGIVMSPPGRGRSVADYHRMFEEIYEQVYGTRNNK